ncbi:MAG: ABC transporter ATP-binding protein [Chloroflexota bacterium]|nr:ABC transporter ATP-binding protein [Chloroflexota bacterium]
MSQLLASHVSKRYGRTDAVKDVSFALEGGTILGLVGPNGAGKSTLLRMLATVLRPSSGRIEIDGVDAIARPIPARRAIGYVPDVYGLPSNVKVWEFLDLFARCYDLRGRARQLTIGELLRLVDLFDFRFACCGSLSRGMQQKLMVARALLNDPALLLLDEPLAGLDAGSRLEMLEVFRELGGIGKAVLISSHAIGELVDVCDRIAIMAAGQLTAVGTVPELTVQLEANQRARLSVLGGADQAHELLRRMEGVSDVELGQGSISFSCQGGQGALADILRELVLAGVRVVQFSSPAQPLTEMVGAMPKTVPSQEQLRP